VARINEAKAIGIPMGAPVHECKDLIRQHGLVVRSSNYALYCDMSRRVMSLLSAYTTNQEIYSIDESFLDFTGMPDPVALAQSLRKDIRRKTGIPVAVAIGPSKTLASQAGQLLRQAARTMERPRCLQPSGTVTRQPVPSAVHDRGQRGLGYRLPADCQAGGSGHPQRAATAHS